MRPGPGLVVMALAFISGARRGSSSSISSTTTTTTTATASTSIGTTSAGAAGVGGGATSGTGATAEGAGGTGTGGGGGVGARGGHRGGGGVGTALPSRGESSSFISSSGSYLLPIFLPHHLDLYRRPTPQAIYQLPPTYQHAHAHAYGHGHDPDDPRARTEALSARLQLRRRRERSLSNDIVGRAGGTRKGAVTETETGTGTGSSNEEEEAEQEQEQEESGLPVQYSSSQALDEDEDIFALVAEDDLLSEESFDRLIKLNEDVDEEDKLNEEDYNIQQQQQQQHEPVQELEADNETEAETETETETETEKQQQDESSLIDESVLQHSDNISPKEFPSTSSQSNSNNNNNNNNNNKREATGNILDAQAAQLIGQKDNSWSGGTFGTSAAVAIASGSGSGSGSAASAEAGAAGGGTARSLPDPVELKKSILGTASSLTRLNPWISACDLAQPGTGTDLQGQCSAGTLPMAWVDEGPGPPTCPRSCAEQQQPSPQKRTAVDSSVSKRSVSSNNKSKYFVNYKTSQMRLGHSNRVMSRVRRERERSEGGDPPVTDMPTTTEADQDQEQDPEQEQEQELELGESATASSTMASPSSEDVEVDAAAEAEAAPTLAYSHLHAQPQIHLDTANQQRPQPEQGQAAGQEVEEQQCLDYLGDAAEWSPQHLCGLESPAELLKRLRTLRLRNCCERSVFSALHTLALNATLSDRGECVRILSDLLEVDALANRITCELAEILFRFDCRQVYSLINQCDDCKEAYRRWVCSTLVPYFAEPKDVAPDGSEQSSSSSSNAKIPGKNKRSAWSATWTEGGEAVAVEAGGSAAAVAGIKNKSLKLISNNNKSNNGNNMNERQINQKPDKSSQANRNDENGNTNREGNTNGIGNGNRNRNGNGDNDRNVEDAIGRNLAQTFYDVVGMSNPHQSQVAGVNEGPVGAMAEAEAEAETQSNNFISTANNADPRALDPVISKLQKRSTRKAEFRKRRRIRPCLSVCQTVEQKCPYLLPADRAPALPTQYAGEPTFLCLDQNIPETGEQLKKSSYGPNDCCYSYCNGPASGVCTVCQEFAPPPRASPNDVAANSTRRVHNITLTLSSPAGEHARAKSVALALRNVTKARDSEQDAMESLMERLPYYARLDSIYYYDEDGEMPKAPLSGNCAPVPAVTTRCTFPYYASGTEAAAPPTQLLVWLSALLGLLSSCGAARQRWSCSWSGGCGQRGRGRQCVNCEASCHEQELIRSRSNAAGSGSRSSRSRSQQSIDGKCAEKAPQAEAEAEAEAESESAWMWAWSVRPQNIHRQMCSKVRYFSSRSKFKCESNCRDLDPLRFRVRVRVRVRPRLRIGWGWSWSWGLWQTREGSTRTINYRYFYYYNYNINDWWRRWWLGEWRRIVGSGAL